MKIVEFKELCVTCNECGDEVNFAVEVGEPDTMESRTAYLCRDCIKKAYELSREQQEDVKATSRIVWWCHTHNRPANHVLNGKQCCDPNLGGILAPCYVTAEQAWVENEEGK
jgi:hypothetical protein